MGGIYDLTRFSVTDSDDISDLDNIAAIRR